VPCIGDEVLDAVVCIKDITLRADAFSIADVSDFMLKGVVTARRVSFKDVSGCSIEMNCVCDVGES